MQHIKSGIIYLIITVLSVATFSFQGLAATGLGNTGTGWKRHTAFDGQVRRIMEGERFVYIWAHQQLYSKGDYNYLKGIYAVPHGTVLYIDKQNLSRGVRALAEDRATTGQDACCVAYNPDKGYLVIAYTSGVIDIVTDAGAVHTIRDFDGQNGGLTIIPRNISFDLVTGDAWIATANGFVRIDGRTFQSTDSADWGTAVDSVCRIGNRLVAIIGKTVYEAFLTTDLHDFENITPYAEAATSLHGIMPVSATSFATLADRSDICLATISPNGNVTMSRQVSDAGFSGQLIAEGDAYTTGNVINFNHILNDAYDNNLIPTRDGFLALSKDYIYLLKYNSRTHKLDCSKRKFNTAYVASLGRQAASWDFENFWFYDHRKGFHREKGEGLDNSTVWTTVTDRLPWQGLVAMQMARLAYSPTRGLICMNRPSTVYSEFTTQSAVPMLMSGYKDGRWINYTPIYKQPDFCSTEGTAKNLFNTYWRNFNAYPINHANSMMVDPLNPDYAVVGSLRSGFIAMNLGNIEGEIMHFSSANDGSYKNYPGFTAAFPSAGMPVSYVCGTDTDGNLWIYYPDHENSTGKGTGINLFCWKRADREAAMAAQDVSKAGTLSHLFFPLDSKTAHGGYFSAGLALKHPSNRNKLVVTPTVNSYSLIILDHGGTLEDASDDQAKVVRNFATSQGLISSAGAYYTMAEHPVTGEVITVIAGNLLRFNPSSPVVNHTIEADIVSILEPDGSLTPVSPNDAVYAISFDEYNRMWIGTGNNGVYGVSADCREMVAHYTTANTPMPSNTVYDVCWNPDSKELFIATDGGIMSMSPYTPTDAAALPYAEPAMVRADYSGTVRLHNVPEGASIVVRNSQGHKVAVLDASSDNRLVWDTCDADGNLVPSGVYTLRDLSGAMDDIRITVLR